MVRENENTFVVIEEYTLVTLAKWLGCRDYDRVFHSGPHHKDRFGNPLICLERDGRRQGIVICRERALWDDTLNTVHQHQAYTPRIIAA